MRSLAAVLLVWLLWIATCSFTVRTLDGPALPTPEGALDFSSGRALVHVRELARAPRPVGTPAHDAARDYLVKVLRELGLGVMVQTSSASSFVAGHHVSADVANVVARLRGSAASSRALLLSAHYDSVEASPGASDDAFGVATLLETARVLKGGPPLACDVIFLFSDAEELGMLGAQAFVAESPDRSDVALALNFDARGSHGAVTMFATSPNNGALIAALGDAPVHPVASSFISKLAATLPNDTDASIFAAAGVATYSFAYADGLEHYHRFSDTPANLDPATLAHAGNYAVALTRYFAEGRLHDLAAEDQIYFDLFARTLVHYPRWAARAMSTAVVALVLALVLGAVRTRVTRAHDIVGRMYANAVSVVLAVVVTGVVAWLVGRVLPLVAVMAHAKVLFSGALLLAIAVVLSMRARRLRKPPAAGSASAGANSSATVGANSSAGAFELAQWLGVWGLWAVVLAAVTAVAPDASAPFFWPIASALVGAGVLAAWRRSRAGASARSPGASAASAVRDDTALAVAVRDDSALGVAVRALALVPACVMMTQITYASLVAIGATMPFVPAAFAMLLFTTLAPAGGLDRGAIAGRAAVGAAALGAALLALGIALAAEEGRATRTDSLVFAVDGDTGAAYWMSFDASPDAWVGQRIAEGSPRVRLPTVTRWDAPLLSAPAENALDLTPAAVHIEPEMREAATRHVRVTVAADRAVRCVALWQDAGPSIVALAVNGRPTRQFVRFTPEIDAKLLRVLSGDGNRESWHLRHCGAEGRPLTLDLTVAGSAPLHLRLVQERAGLPSEPTLRPRDGTLAPRQDSDVTLYAQKLVL